MCKAIVLGLPLKSAVGGEAPPNDNSQRVSSYFHNIATFWFGLFTFLYFFLRRTPDSVSRSKFFPNVSYYFFQYVVENIEIHFFKERLNTATLHILESFTI